MPCVRTTEPERPATAAGTTRTGPPVGGSPPTQVLWAGKGSLEAWYDPLAIWREWADDVTGRPFDCGHFLMEEAPGETLAAIRDFHATPR
jgi:pimeloyl-ACP methyl ester carboxylesterase